MDDILNIDQKSIVTHVLTSSADQSRLSKIKQIRRSLPQGKKFRIIKDTWIHDCLNEESMVGETEYEL